MYQQKCCGTVTPSYDNAMAVDSHCNRLNRLVFFLADPYFEEDRKLKSLCRSYEGIRLMQKQKEAFLTRNWPRLLSMWGCVTDGNVNAPAENLHRKSTALSEPLPLNPCATEHFFTQELTTILMHHDLPSYNCALRNSCDIITRYEVG